VGGGVVGVGGSGAGGCELVKGGCLRPKVVHVVWSLQKQQQQ
jgi:hypothetical protein